MENSYSPQGAKMMRERNMNATEKIRQRKRSELIEKRKLDPKTPIKKI